MYNVKLEEGNYYDVQFRASELDQGYGKVVTEMLVIEIFGSSCTVRFDNVNGVEDYITVISTSQAERFVENYNRENMKGVNIMEKKSIAVLENLKKFECHVQVVEFSIPDSIWFPHKDYLCVSSRDNEAYMNDCIKAFSASNGGNSVFPDAIIMPRRTWTEVFSTTFQDLQRFNTMLDNIKPSWDCCDDSQWVRYNGKHEYEFYQIMEDDEGTCRVYHETVNTSDFISPQIRNDEDFEHAVSTFRSYGYGWDLSEDLLYRDQLTLILEELKNIYGADNREQIIAEMLFETFFMSNCECAFESYGEALDYVMNHMGFNH